MININCSQKLGKIKTISQTLNEKLKNSYHSLCQLKCYVLYFFYKFNLPWHTGIIVLNNIYNHLQPPDVADFFHVGNNYELGHIFSLKSTYFLLEN